VALTTVKLEDVGIKMVIMAEILDKDVSLSIYSCGEQNETYHIDDDWINFTVPHDTFLDQPQSDLEIKEIVQLLINGSACP